MGGGWRRGLARWVLGGGVPVLLLAVAWRHTDIPAAMGLLSRAGPLVALVPLPFAAMLAADAAGWKRLLAPAARRRLPLREAVAARLAGEAVAQTLPSAGLAGEATSAWLASRRTGLALTELIGSLAARRVLLALGHAVALAVACAVASRQAGVPSGLVAGLAAAAAALGAAALAGSRLLVRGLPFVRLHVALRRLPWAGLRAWAGHSSGWLVRAGREAARPLAGAASDQALAVAGFTLVFLLESLESFLLLRLLGADVTPGQVLAVEPLVGLMRALAFFVPAGLGVQEVGYLGLLPLAGVGDAAATGTAFVLLKRLKELVWMAGGWGLLLAGDARSVEGGNERRTAPASLRVRVDEPDHADARGRPRAARA